MRWQIWTLKRPVVIYVGIRKIIMPLTRPKILTTFTVLAQLNSSLHQIHNFTMHSLNHRPKVKKNHLVSWINKDKGWPGFSFIKQGPGWNMLRAKGSGMGFLGSSNLYHLSKSTRTWSYITTNDHNHSERWKAWVQRLPLAEQANDQQQNMLVLYNHACLYGYWCSRKVIGFHYLVRFVQLHQVIQSFLSHLQVFFQRNITFLQNIIIIHLQQEIEMQINIIKQYSQ